MKERPIPFIGAMVRAILDGRKTQTRRVIKNLDLIQANDPPSYMDKYGDWHVTATRCPYGQPGDRLWVRETWALQSGAVLYRANFGLGSFEYDAKGWKPSIFMPRAASRITLEIVGVRVERVQDISAADARAEGIQITDGHLSRPIGSPEPPTPYTHRQAFESLWDAINDKRGYGWEGNPWVWVVEFRLI